MLKKSPDRGLALAKSKRVAFETAMASMLDKVHARIGKNKRERFRRHVGERLAEDGSGRLPLPAKNKRDRSRTTIERRHLNAQSTLVERGGFTQGEAYLAVYGCRQDPKEPVAFWLRGELKKVRDAEAQTFPRIEIADLAMTMLESLDFSEPGENLICLFQELLDVDRHRKALTSNEAKFTRAALIDGVGLVHGWYYGVRELARLIGVGPSTVIKWRKSAAYHTEISHGLWISPRAVAALLASPPAAKIRKAASKQLLKSFRDFDRRVAREQRRQARRAP